MHRSNKLAFINLTQSFLDILIILCAFFMSYFVTNMTRYLHDINFYNWIIVVFAPTWMMTMSSYSMYDNTTFNNYTLMLKTIIKSTAISGIVVVFLIYTAKIEGFSRVFMGSFLVLVVCMAFFERVLYLKMTKKIRSSYIKQVIIIGSPDMYKRFSSYLAKTNIRLKIKGYVSVSNSKPLKEHAILGNLENLEKIIKEYTIDEVILALPKNYVGEVEKYIIMCETMGITVRMIVDLYDLKLSKVHITNIGTLPLVTFHTVSLNSFQLMIKRILDIIGSLVGLVITLFMGIFVVVAIKLESGGPVLFRQNRVGLNGRVFKCYKFRSMYKDAEARKKELMGQNEMKNELMFKMKDDPRITKVGNFLRKTSLDELPQFWNVLKGEMSLVGTRPPTVEEVRKYTTGHRRRISIKPGITGLWQVNGRSSIKDFEDVVRLDTNYIDNWSVIMDLKIIFKTVFVVLKGSEIAY
jgi:exopolysaccharide biosynthesis polyprenyl glycosylphosphotransferase